MSTIRPYFCFIIATVTFVFSLTACGTPPLPSALGPEPMRLLVRIEARTPFAGNETGSHVAYVADGLKLLDLSQPEPVELNNHTPDALTWSPDGKQLAAAFASGNETRLVLFGTDGKIITEQTLPITFQALHWTTRGDLLVLGYRLKVFSFGSNLRQMLYVRMSTGLLEIQLGDITLKPGTTKRYAPELRQILTVGFSAQGDELLYPRLHDPPELAPYLQLVYRNWQVPDERVLARIELQQILPVFNASSDLALISLADSSVVTIPLWNEEKPGREAMPVNSAADVVSPSGRYRYYEGRLLDRGQLLTEWPADARLQFLGAGRFLLAEMGRLFLGDGLQTETRPVYRDRDWMLRRWCQLNLISPDEYRRTRAGGLP